MNTRPDSLPVILLAEDEELLRWSAADLLEEKGFKVIEAENAEAALKVLRDRSDVRLLFTDIQMPGALNGMDLVQKEHEQRPKVKLLITSGNLKPADAEIPDHGHFIGKPYEAANVTADGNRLLGLKG
jgi:two-component system, response regulator PdtaR